MGTVLGALQRLPCLTLLMGLRGSHAAQRGAKEGEVGSLLKHTDFKGTKDNQGCGSRAVSALLCSSWALPGGGGRGAAGGSDLLPMSGLFAVGAPGPVISAGACTDLPLALLNDSISLAIRWACP